MPFCFFKLLCVEHLCVVLRCCTGFHHPSISGLLVLLLILLVVIHNSNNCANQISSFNLETQVLSFLDFHCAEKKAMFFLMSQVYYDFCIALDTMDWSGRKCFKFVCLTLDTLGAKHLYGVVESSKAVEFYNNCIYCVKFVFHCFPRNVCV